MTVYEKFIKLQKIHKNIILKDEFENECYHSTASIPDGIINEDSESGLYFFFNEYTVTKRTLINKYKFNPNKFNDNNQFDFIAHTMNDKEYFIFKNSDNSYYIEEVLYPGI